MPNIKSQKKRVLTNAKSQLANKAVKSSLRTTIKKADASLAEKGANRDEIVADVFSSVDKAAKRNVIHKNTANRRKAAIAKKAAAEQE